MSKATKTTKNSAKKLGIRLTTKAGAKTEQLLKKQIATAKKRKKPATKPAKKRTGRRKGLDTVSAYEVAQYLRKYPSLASYPRKRKKRATKKKSK